MLSATLVTTPCASTLGVRLQQASRHLSEQWLERLLALVPVDARSVFPSDLLLDHIPTLIDEIGKYVADPTEEEMQKLANCYDLHPLAVEDALKANQLPKIDVYDDQLFVVARTAHLMEDHIDYGETAIFVGHSHIISVRHGSTRAHTALRDQLEKSPRLLMHGVDYLLHAILDYIVDGYLPLIEDLEEEVLEMETKAIDSFLARQEVNRIFTVRRELIRFQRILGPMGDVAQTLARQELPCIDAEARV